QRGEALAEPASDDLETAQGRCVSLAGGLGDLAPVDSVGGSAAELQQPDRPARRTPGELACLGDQGAPARVLLPAAAIAAPAQPPFGYDPVVPGLAGDPPPAPVQLPVDHDPGADSGADRDEHDVLVAARGAEHGLGPGGGVRVVLHYHGQACVVFDPLLQRLVAPGEVGREQHAGPGDVDEPGGADAHGVHLVPAGQLGDG